MYSTSLPSSKLRCFQNKDARRPRLSTAFDILNKCFLKCFWSIVARKRLGSWVIGNKRVLQTLFGWVMVALKGISPFHWVPRPAIIYYLFFSLLFVLYYWLLLCILAWWIACSTQTITVSLHFDLAVCKSDRKTTIVGDALDILTKLILCWN